jgi:hypothetical protein
MRFKDLGLEADAARSFEREEGPTRDIAGEAL